MKRTVPSRRQASACLAAAIPSASISQPRLLPTTTSILSVRRRAILEVMYHCGLRSIEVVNLKRDEIEWPSDDNRQQAWLHLSRTKGNKPRSVPVPDVCLEWLAKWQERSDEYLRERELTTHIFFHRIEEGDIAAPLTTRALRYMIERVAQNALGDQATAVSPHSFRHAFCTNALEDGVPTHLAQAMMGHASPRTTDRYSHARPDELYARMKNAR